MTTNRRSVENSFHVGKFITGLLEEKKMTKRQLAVRLEMSEVNVFKILKKKAIGMDLLSRILEILETKVLVTRVPGKLNEDEETILYEHMPWYFEDDEQFAKNYADDQSLLSQGHDLSLMVQEQNMTILELEKNLSNFKSEIKSYIDAMSLLTISPPETIHEKLAYSKVMVMTSRFKNLLGDTPKKKRNNKILPKFYSIETKAIVNPLSNAESNINEGEPYSPQPSE